jgi:hypothetical protein
MIFRKQRDPTRCCLRYVLIVPLYQMMVYFMEAHELYFTLHDAPVAQLDRVLVSETKGREFESRRARQFLC